MTQAVAESQQQEMISDSELHNLGLSFCKITGIKPNSGGDKPEDKSARIGLSIKVSPDDESFIKIVQPGIRAALKAGKDGDSYLFESMPFMFKGGMSVKLALHEKVSLEPFFNTSVALHKSAVIKVVDGSLHLQISFTMRLDDMGHKLMFGLYSMFEQPIFCTFIKEDVQIDDEGVDD